MANILDQYWQNGRLMTADDFQDRQVPGATGGVDPAELAEPIAKYNDQNAEAVAAQVNDLTAMQGQHAQLLTDEQKAQKEAQEKVRRAQLAEHKAQGEALKAQQAKEDLLPPGEQSDPAAWREEAAQFNDPTPDDGLQAPGIAEQPVPQGINRVNQGLEQQKTGGAQTTGGEVAVIEGNAEINKKMGDAVLKDQALAHAEQAKRVKLENKRGEVTNRIRAEVESNVKKPSPSALALVGVFLNGLIAPMQGGKNVALETVQRQMQREVDVDIENRRVRMKGLQQEKGMLLDEEAGIEKQAIAKDIMLAQKYKGFRMQLEAKLLTPGLTAKVKGDMSTLIGQLNERGGLHEMKAAKEMYARMLKAQELADKRNIAAAKARKGSGGGGNKKGPKGGVVSEAQNSPLYYDAATGHTVDFTGMDPAEQKVARGELAQIPIVDSSTGNVLRGIRGLDDKQAQGIRKVWKDRNNVRLGSQRILSLLGSATGSDRTSIGGAFTSVDGALLEAEFTHLMVALKDQWELGAIQKPDEKLMEGAMGMKPSKAWAFLADKMSLNQIEGVIKGMQSRGGLKMKTDILSDAGLPAHMQIQMPRYDATSDLDQSAREQAPQTNEEVQGNLSALTQALNDGDEGVSLDDVRDGVNQMVKRWQKGTFNPSMDESETGGLVAKGNEEIVLRGLMKKATDPKLKAIYKQGLADLTKKPEKNTLLAKAHKLAQAKKKAKKAKLDKVTKSAPYSQGK